MIRWRSPRGPFPGRGVSLLHIKELLAPAGNRLMCSCESHGARARRKSAKRG